MLPSSTTDPHFASGVSLLQRISLFLFFLSGVAGLMYEVLWVRQFTHLLGASTYAVTVVLTTFMLGLGMGAWIIGRVADKFGKKNLIRLYCTIEVGIAVYAVLFPLLLNWAEGAYIGFYQLHHPSTGVFNGIKILTAFLLLAVPTLLIGATLPVLTCYFIKDQKGISLSVSRLYAYNTVGAITGTIATGYIFLPFLGIRSTSWVAICLSLLVAFGFYFVGSFSHLVVKPNAEIRGRTPEGIKEKLTPVQKSVIIGFTVSGATAMFYEVAWTRTLSMILGTTTYAFTTMLAAFLLGIGLGSLCYRYIPETFPRIRLFSILQAVIGFAVVLTIPAFEKLPFVFLTLHLKWVDTWITLQLIRFCLALLVMFIPCLAMGILFPVVSDIFIDKPSHVGSRLGLVYGWNTFGASMGAALAGLALVPSMGMQKTILLGGAINILVALCQGFFQPDLSIRRRMIVSTATGIAVAVLILNTAPWAPKIMSSGAYVYASRYEAALDRYRVASDKSDEIPGVSDWKLWEMAMNQFHLLYYNTGITATVAVMEGDDGVRFLTIDGKTDASTGKKSDLRTQVMIAQLPLLFHPNPDNVLVVGLGSGITVGSVLTHDVRAVDCAEISPSVIEAASYFSEANHDALADRRLRIIPQDARNMLLVSKKLYDVVISQPSNPWINGESSLFSQEWYHLVHEHMDEGGLFLQWLPSYLMDETDLKTIIHTMRSVFPNLTLWSSGSAGDLILIAGKSSSLRLDYALLSKRVNDERIHQDIIRTGLDPAVLPFNLFVMNSQKLSSYLYTNLKNPLMKNTDDRLITEFSTPKRMVKNQKVARFVDPILTHGDIQNVLPMMDHFETEKILQILGQKT